MNAPPTSGNAPDNSAGVTLIHWVTELVDARAPRRVLVGLVGAPGAGKSTLAGRLADALPHPAAVLPMDGFHLPQARLIELDRRERMGAPDTFDVAGFVEVLAAVRADDGEVTAPGFDRTIEEPVPHAIRIDAGVRVVVVEGNYLLHDADGWESVAGLLDATAYLRLPDAERRRRLEARHVAFGKTADAARAWAAGPDETNAALIRASETRADLVVDAEPSDAERGRD